ncbi:hypothetical protein B0I35DRAFT_235917 [Stachybotrys elegans]|uniref:RING-type domain-containing protein n=1 Tax=Stachybotrys elegans TaxID=80388 RepID=A0A8K0SU97_9HYPO|nr:hypothetical protein B0I35DRAFT_235917 [Stachybotrys elegans]
MEPQTFVLITVMVIFCIIGPMICASALRRKPDTDPYQAEPNHLARARQRLSTVTSIKACGHGDGADDHAEARELGECSICIGPLVPEPACTDNTTTSSQPHVSALPVVAVKTLSSSSSSAAVSEGVIQSGSADQETKSTARHSTLPTQPEELPDEVLTLQSCGHCFHARCLSSWFLIRRYDCPVCRAPYYTPPTSPPSPLSRRSQHGAMARSMV